VLTLICIWVSMQMLLLNCTVLVIDKLVNCTRL